MNLERRTAEALVYLQGKLAWFRRTTTVERWVVGWLVGLTILWLVSPPIARHISVLLWLPGLLALYRVLDITVYALHQLIVERKPGVPWFRESLPRSFILAFVNLAELIVGFAVIYLTFATIQYGDHPVTTLNAIQALYFSAATFLTVGYGDFTPANDLSRLLVIGEFAVSILFVAAVLPVLMSDLIAHTTKPKSNDKIV
jgi:hypothetical protein